MCVLALLSAVADRQLVRDGPKEGGRGLIQASFLMKSRARQTGSSMLGPLNQRSTTPDPKNRGEKVGRAHRYSGISNPSPSLLALGSKTEAKRNVTGPSRLHQLGPDGNRRQFPRPPSSQGQQACPGLGQAQLLWALSL